VSLSIGRSSNAPPAAAAAAQPPVSEAKAKPAAAAPPKEPAPRSTPPSTASTPKAAAKESRSGTSTPALESIVTADKIAQEVAAVADEESMEDLYGSGQAPGESLST
jgi:hypothetical protein